MLVKVIFIQPWPQSLSQCRSQTHTKVTVLKENIALSLTLSTTMQISGTGTYFAVHYSFTRCWTRKAVVPFTWLWWFFARIYSHDAL